MAPLARESPSLGARFASAPLKGFPNIRVYVDTDFHIWLASSAGEHTSLPKFTPIVGFGTGHWEAAEADEKGYPHVCAGFV